MSKARQINFGQEVYDAFGQVKDFTLAMRIARYFYEKAEKDLALTWEDIAHIRTIDQRLTAELGITRSIEMGVEAFCSEVLKRFKAINHTTIKSAIVGAIPSTIKPAFYFNNDETQGSNITMGTTVTVKVGTYGVRWNNSPNSIVNVVNSNTSLAKAPLLDINTEVTIVPGTTEYSIPVTFKSFAVVIDATEVSKVQYYTLGGAFADIDFFLTSGDNLIIFINGEFTNDGVVRIRLIPADEYKKETTFFLSNQVEKVGKNFTTHVDYGKYYVLHPDAVTEIGSLFNLTIPEWECGNEED